MFSTADTIPYQVRVLDWLYLDTGFVAASISGRLWFSGCQSAPDMFGLYKLGAGFMGVLGGVVAGIWNKEKFSVQCWGVRPALADHFQLFLFLFADAVKNKVFQSAVCAFGIHFLILNRAVQ